jgi:type II secretion system protein C
MRLIGQLNRLLWGLNLALLAVVLVAVVVSLAPERSGQPAVVPASPAVTAKGPELIEQKVAEQVDPRLILDRDIFGIGHGAATGGPAKPEAVALERPKVEIKRELPLRLLGTVVDEKGASYAIVENLATKAQDIYRVGDAVGEVRIDSIEQNKIVVMNVGVRETLSIALTASNVPVTTVASQAAPPAELVKVPAAEVVRVVSGSERQINTRASAQSYNQAAQFLSKLQVSPHVTDGQPDGLRVSGVGDSAMAQLVGLRDGDVIRAINGHPISNERKASEVLRTARKIGHARIELMRGQERRSLAFHGSSW